LRGTLFLMGFSIFVAVLTAILKPALAYFWGVEHLGPILSRRAVYLVLTALLGLEGFSGVIALSSRLFTGLEGELILSSPLDPKVYFRFRFWQACTSTGWMLLPIWLPLMLAVKAAAHWSWLQLAWGLMIPLALSPLASVFALVLVMESSRLVSPERLRLFFVVMSAVAAVGIIFLIRLIQPEKLADPASAVSAAEILKNWSMPEPWWNPARAATDAVLGFDIVPALELYATAFLASALGLGFYSGKFYVAWQRIHALASAQTRTRKISYGWAKVQRTWSALGMKEVSAFLRNPTQRLQLLFVASLIGIFIYNLYRLPIKNDASLAEMLFLPACGFSQLILIAVATRFVFPAESAEASGAWMLRAAPLSHKTYLFSRLAIYCPPLLALNALLIGSCVRAFVPSAPQEAAAIFLGFFSPFGVVALSAGLGLAWKRSSNAPPEELVTSAVGVLVMLSSVGYVLGELGLLALPLYEYHRVHQLLWVKANYLLLGTAALLWVLLQVAVVVLPLRMAARRMREAG
jgi:ABC-2 type transport system permease protein